MYTSTIKSYSRIKETIKMITKTLSGWKIIISQKDDKLTLKVSHEDGTNISDTDADFGDDDDLCYRLTSKAIEDEYDLNGEARSEPTEVNTSIGNWKISLINDDDNQLNILCKHSTSNNLGYLSIVDDQKECAIVLTDSEQLK